MNFIVNEIKINHIFDFKILIAFLMEKVSTSERN